MMPEDRQKEPIRKTVRKRGVLYLIIILTVTTFVTILSSSIAYINLQNAAEESLRLQALGIAVSLEGALSSGVRNAEDLLRTVIAEGTWEGVAYIGLYDSTGRTILHSNRNLAGKVIDDPRLSDAAVSGRILQSGLTLGTGEDVFVLYYPVTLVTGNSVLKLALHRHPVEKIALQAKFQIVSLAGVLSILWILGFFLVRSLGKSEALRRNLEERERFAIMGEMASVLAHEIRNPLGSIKGFAQYLLEKELPGDEGRKRYLSVIISESKRLERMTEDLLQYARPVAIRPRVFYLGELLGELLNGFRKDARWPGVQFSLDAPELTISTDPDRLREIISNLVSNAADAVAEDGRVAVAAEREGQKTIIRVTDNGCGMTEDIRESVFKPFFTTKTKGTGLGLPIVARLVEALGGSIEISSEPGKGTEIIVSVPEKKEPSV